MDRQTSQENAKRIETTLIMFGQMETDRDCMADLAYCFNQDLGIHQRIIPLEI